MSSPSQQGLLRYRSAPSSLLGEICDDFLPAGPPRPPSSPDAADTMLARFLSSGSQFPPSEPPPLPQVSRAEESHSMFYHHQQNQQHQPQHQMQNQANHSHSVAMETAAAAGGGCPSLIRHSSSPAGLFSHLNVENGYGLMRSMSGVRNGTGSSGEAGGGTQAATGRLKSQLSYSSRQGSLMSQISEMRSDGVRCSSPEESSGGGGGRCYIPGYPIGSWDESQVTAVNFSGLRRARDPGLNQSDLQNGEIRNNSAGLAHQFSLPKTSSEMAAMEKFFEFQDAVPCKVRAKRGCATHPRSIAERVRRTRISERMRKLQELVPNMDKQTNTADMLDLAVDYIKDLQKQLKSLSDNRANCTCSSGNQKPYHQPS